MEYKKPSLIIDGKPFEILSFDEFREKKGLHLMANASIAYNIDQDKLDYVILGRFRYIVWNKKAREFNLMIRRPNNQTVPATA